MSPNCLLKSTAVKVISSCSKQTGPTTIASMANSTTLNLLTRQGAYAVTFTPALEPAQYDELFEFAQPLEQEVELRTQVKEMAGGD